jgi:hypothetical protein
MKMADLTAGTEYLAASGNDWASTPYRASRVRVLSTDRLVTTRSRYGYGYGGKPPVTMEVTLNGVAYTAPARKASHHDRVDAVLVIGLDAKTGLVQKNATPRFVPLRDLRGEWAIVYPEVVARDAAIAQARREAEQRRNDTAARVQAAVKALAAKGVKVPHVGSWDTKATFGPEALEQIIALIEG